MTDFDSPWKEALDVYFQPFLAFFFPWIHEDIDWSRGYEPLDKEFQQLVREAEVGRRYVDKLFKVWRKDGTEAFVLIHVEVQTTRDAEFPRRMYVYNFRAADRYNRDVVSLGVLADDDPDWCPDSFVRETWGCRRGLWFPAAKLLRYAGRELELEADANPFATLVLAHLKAMETRKDSASRHAWKLRLVRNLYERGRDAKDVRELFRLIDWMMALPTLLDRLFWDEWAQIQREGCMPFITTPQRIGRLDGLLEAIEDALQLRFGEEGVKLMPQLRPMYDPNELRLIHRTAIVAKDLDEVRRVAAEAATRQPPDAPPLYDPLA